MDYWDCWEWTAGIRIVKAIGTTLTIGTAGTVGTIAIVWNNKNVNKLLRITMNYYELYILY